MRNEHEKEIDMMDEFDTKEIEKIYSRMREEILKEEIEIEIEQRKNEKIIPLNEDKYEESKKDQMH